MKYKIIIAVSGIALVHACTPNANPSQSFEAVQATFGSSVPVEPPFDYSSTAPGYITKDVAGGLDVEDELATLGRVLFYDTQLSLNNSIACASCHQQEAAFGDSESRSTGLDGGLTGRQSMRLVNIRFATSPTMFWDERAINLNDQVTQPIQDHVEMGFSGTQGQPTIDSLLDRLMEIDYYNELFEWAFDGSSTVTEAKIAEALEHFVLSIESFDSKYDQGFALNGGANGGFPNFTTSENQGKTIFTQAPQVNNQGVRIGGGAGCVSCHQAPEFSIAPNSQNNGVDHEAGNPAGFDTTNTKSPSLRDLVGLDGTPNTPMMHTGDFLELTTIIEHYNEVIPNVNNTTVDPRLQRGANAIQLELTTTERTALEDFLKTLTGQNVYTDARWSDPF